MRAKVAERGQVTIPKPLRERLGIMPGTMLDFEAENGRLVAVKTEAVDKLDAIYGRFGRGRRSDAVVAELRGGR
jgi:antitoxin PrlF